MNELIESEKKPIFIFNDNQRAQKLAIKQIFHERSTHIDVRHHFIRDAVSNELVVLKYLKISEIPADYCEPKQHHRLPFNHKGTRATKLLEIIHTDVCGRMQVQSLGGSKYSYYSLMTLVKWHLYIS